MKKYSLSLLFCVLSFYCMSQSKPANRMQLTKENEEYWKKWQGDLYEVGIKLNKDSLVISPESKKIMQDSSYRKQLFPSNYTWAKAVEYLNQMEVKKAFWYFIKLYGEDTAHRSLVIESLAPFDKALQVDKVLISTFYTYAFLDPKICAFKNNRMVVTHPDVLEKEFSNVKQMIESIKSARDTARK